nr:hypothetical protein [Paenibacillus bovis]
MTADEIMKAIKEMENGERIKLLNQLFDSYFDSRPPKERKKKCFGAKNEETITND